MIKYQLHISSKAQKDFQKLDPQVRNRLKQAIIELKTNQRPQQFKPLIGHKVAQFRLRVGDYRILYDVYDRDRTVLILRVGHRKEVYK